MSSSWAPGPPGLACGIELKRRGVSAVLIDKGCVVNSLYHYPTNMVFFTTPELLEIGDIPMTSLNEKPVRAEALKYYRRVADHYKLDIRQYQRVERIAGEDGAFVTHATDAHGCPHQYASKKVILATGYYDVPNLLNVPGEDLPKVIHYYKEAHPYYNHDVLVVGAKNSAGDRRAGTVVDRRARDAGASRRGDSPAGEILDQAEHRESHQERRDPGVLPLARGGDRRTVRAHRDARTARIELKNDFVFAMTGYRPDSEFLAAHGIRFDPKTQRPYTNPETLESDRKGMYLAGVLVAGMHTNEIFIENGRFHGKMIAEAIAKQLG